MGHPRYLHDCAVLTVGHEVRHHRTQGAVGHLPAANWLRRGERWPAVRMATCRLAQPLLQASQLIDTRPTSCSCCQCCSGWTQHLGLEGSRGDPWTQGALPKRLHGPSGPIRQSNNVREQLHWHMGIVPATWHISNIRFRGAGPAGCPMESIHRLHLQERVLHDDLHD